MSLSNWNRGRMPAVAALLCGGALALAGATGCGSDVDATGPGGSGGQGQGGQGQGGQGQGGQGQGGDDGTCSDTKACSGGAFCVYPVGACGPEAVGSCQNGFTCDGPPSGPVCRCDGTVLEGEYAICDAWADSVKLAEPSVCATGTFPCGDTSCVRHAEVCVATLPGPAGPTSYSCQPANGSCSGIADCSCLDLQALGCPDTSCCSVDMDMQETITIALP